MEESELLRSEGFQVFKKIGKGALVKVYLVQHPDVGVIAAKVIQNENFEENEWTAAGVFVGDPPNTRSFIVKYIAAKKFDEMTVILMEWANIGSLIELIKTNIDIPIPVVRMIMKDIKGGNILMHCPPGSGRVVLKIADFGEAKLKAGIDQSQEITIVGTPQYMAPELFLFGNEVRVNADAKIDIWSFGIFVYLLISHTFPFKSLIYEDIRTFMINQRFERHPKIIDDQLWNLLQQMISFDPINRISAVDALNHPFIQNYQPNNEQNQLAQIAQQAQYRGDQSISQFDTIPIFIFPLSEVQKILGQVIPDSEMMKIRSQTKLIQSIQQQNQNQFSQGANLFGSQYLFDQRQHQQQLLQQQNNRQYANPNQTYQTPQYYSPQQIQPQIQPNAVPNYPLIKPQ